MEYMYVNRSWVTDHNVVKFTQGVCDFFLLLQLPKIIMLINMLIACFLSII